MITGATVHLATPPRPASPRTGRITDPGRAQSRLAGAVPLERRQARNKVQQPGMDYTGLPAREIERLARSVSPGNWAVERERPLSTLLGSCIAVCLFDPQARVGGINHFMLPSMKRNRHARVDSLLAGDFAMEALLNALLQQGARKQHMRAKAFGGGTIINSALNIGLRNADFTREWLAREGIPLLASD
ncbi:MAG: chemotaxis protein CheD, partial [Burkholderiales bacterium]